MAPRDGSPQIVRLDRTASTNADAMARARDGERGPAWIVAREQTAGRGRHGRVWSSPPGNLYASCLLTDPCEAEHAPQLGFVAGVALCDAVRAVAPEADVRLKWPNDLLAWDAKVAGILLEASRLLDGVLACVVGIGVNCRSHPDGLPYKTGDLSEAAGRDVAPERLFERLAETFAAGLELWDRGRGFADVRSAWLRGGPALGAPLAVSSPDRVVRGRFQTIDMLGRLVLQTETGPVTVEAGDVRWGDGARPANEVAVA